MMNKVILNAFLFFAFVSPVLSQGIVTETPEAKNINGITITGEDLKTKKFDVGEFLSKDSTSASEVPAVITDTCLRNEFQIRNPYNNDNLPDSPTYGHTAWVLFTGRPGGSLCFSTDIYGSQWYTLKGGFDATVTVYNPYSVKITKKYLDGPNYGDDTTPKYLGVINFIVEYNVKSSSYDRSCTQAITVTYDGYWQTYPNNVPNCNYP